MHQRAESFYQYHGLIGKGRGVVIPQNWNTLLFACSKAHFYPTNSSKPFLGGIYMGLKGFMIEVQFGKHAGDTH